MSGEEKFTASSKTLIVKDGHFVAGSGRARLLELIDETGSIREAADSMGMSYRHAWGMLRKVSSAVGGEVVESVRGGSGGGRTTLTTLGRRVLSEYRKAEEGGSNEYPEGEDGRIMLKVGILLRSGDRVFLETDPSGISRIPRTDLRFGESLRDALARVMIRFGLNVPKKVSEPRVVDIPDMQGGQHMVFIRYCMDRPIGEADFDSSALGRWCPMSALPPMDRCDRVVLSPRR